MEQLQAGDNDNRITLMEPYTLRRLWAVRGRDAHMS